MPPLIYALTNQFKNMRFHPNTRNLTNGKAILKNIAEQHLIDATIIKHIQIIKTFAGFQFGLSGVPIEDLLLPLLDKRPLAKLCREHFPQLTPEMLYAVFFGISQIINSTRLDLRHDVNQPDDTHWYYQKTNNGYTINRQYFYEGLQDYILTRRKAEFFYHYLTATSSSPKRGLKTIAFFDAARINGKFTIVIPNTQFTYNDILHAVVESPYFHKLILKECAFTFKPSLAAVAAGLLFLEMLWGCFTIEDNGRKGISPFDERNGLIIRKNTYHDIKWKQEAKTKIYEFCHFQRVDFSEQLIEDDFIFCTFEECEFYGMTIPPEGVQGRFPILRCTFTNCKNIPQDMVFQNGIKGCKFVYG